jgi:hypothetical protein
MDIWLYNMDSHMKTTLVIDDTVMRRLKGEAAKQGCTMSELVETALRRLLDERAAPAARLKPMPKFAMGRMLVDVANRDALYDAMERK